MLHNKMKLSYVTIQDKIKFVSYKIKLSYVTQQDKFKFVTQQDKI